LAHNTAICGNTLFIIYDANFLIEIFV